MPQTNDNSCLKKQSKELPHNPRLNHRISSSGECRSQRSSLRYLSLLKAYCLKYNVFISHHIFNQSGRLLLRKGAILSGVLVGTLQGQRLIKPLASCINIQK